MCAAVSDLDNAEPTKADVSLEDTSEKTPSVVENGEIYATKEEVYPYEDTGAVPPGKFSEKSASGRGITWITAAIIIVADMVGGGLVAMPAGFRDTGLVLGTIFMVLIAITFTSTAHLLAQIWGTMRDRWPVYKQHCRRPYPEMGMRCYGQRMRAFTAFVVYATLYGTTTVYVILSASIFHNFLAFLHAKIPFCILIVIMAVIIWPVTLLKSPADFWAVIGFALTCTFVAVVLILIAISLDYEACKSEAAYTGVTFHSVYSLGTFIFAYSGHHVFPTVQHDMKEPKEFTKSVLLGYFMCVALYVPVSIYSYVVYGNSMISSVINNLQTIWIRYAADLAIAFHCLLTITLTINPINQQLEELVHIPQRFCWQRVAIRTALLLVVLFTALTVPSFGSVMDFFGSTTIPFTCVILPTIFGLSLKAQEFNYEKHDWETPSIMKIIKRADKLQMSWFLLINVVTIICCAISAVLSVIAMVTIRFVPPCYVQWAQHKDCDITGRIFNCCGANFSIYRGDSSVCFADTSKSSAC